jgi:outer membrane murein-binding lipoprotein Lpp
VRTQTHLARAGRSQRDELERLQEELRARRQRREVLPRENAELAAEVARLEQEVRALRQRVGEARTEAERAAPSLPDTLTLPFHVLPSRRTLYGRLHLAFREWSWGAAGVLVQLSVAGRSRRLAALGMFLLAGLVLVSFLQGPEDDDGPMWSFGEEGFASTRGVNGSSGRVLYSELKKVEVRRGWLARLFGFGSVRVTWTPGAPTPLGKAAGSKERRVDIELLDEPQRLAEWLQARMPGKEARRVG